jgi:hypothetical protein
MLDIAAAAHSKHTRRSLVNQVAKTYPVVASKDGLHIAKELSKVIHGETFEERQAAALLAHEMLVESCLWY